MGAKDSKQEPKSKRKRNTKEPAEKRHKKKPGESSTVQVLMDKPEDKDIKEELFGKHDALQQDGDPLFGDGEFSCSDNENKDDHHGLD